MLQCKCIAKIKDKHGNIKIYRLQMIDGSIQEVVAPILKQMIDENVINVVNLKLTSNGRLIDATVQNKSASKANMATRMTDQQNNRTLGRGLGPQHTGPAFVDYGPRTVSMTHNAERAFIPKNMGDVYDKFEELINKHPNTPWKSAKETDKMKWVRVVYLRYTKDNSVDIITELKNIILNASKTLPKHRYNVIGYEHYSIDKNKLYIKDTKDNEIYDYAGLCTLIRNCLITFGKKVDNSCIEAWALNITAQIVDADVEDDIEDIVQSLMDETYID